jgi:wyosine [tRNA(Phe)-imidazoG37] synthetase (radical SAM superfamily)
VSEFKYCFGPVGSWRLGVSLGIDPISRPEKVCNFDCVYCQIGHAAPALPCRADYVRPEDLGAELAAFNAPADYLTFSGRGEPTLASNLPDLLAECGRRRREKTAILTNASLIHSEKIREELAAFDFVVAKLDAPDAESFREINRPVDGVSFDEIVKGLTLFSKGRRNRLAIQTMLIAGNKARVLDLAANYAAICPDEVQLNTPLRPCQEKPLSRVEMDLASMIISEELSRLGTGGIKVVNVYDQKAPTPRPLSAPDTLRRRGKI